MLGVIALIFNGAIGDILTGRLDARPDSSDRLKLTAADDTGRPGWK